MIYISSSGKKNKLFFLERSGLFLSTLISLTIFFAFLDLIVADSHQVYTFTSLSFFFLSSLVSILLSTRRILVAQLSSIMINLYFLHRVPLLYFMPEWLDYSSYLINSHEYINEASIFFFLDCLFLMIGIMGGRIFWGTLNNSPLKVLHRGGEECISYFIVRANWAEFLKTSNVVVGSFLLLQIFSLAAYKIGIIGYVYEDYSHSIILALSEITRYYLAIGIFCLFLGLHSNQEIILRRTIFLIFIVLLSYAIIASRAVILYAAIYAYIAIQLIGLERQQKYAALFIKLIFLAVILYPLITYSRYIFLDQEAPSFFTYFLQFNFIEEISHRLGASVESYLLWYKYMSINPHEQILSFKNLIIQCINGLVPGSIFSEEGLVNISKLQVGIGRSEVPYYVSDQFLNEIGGHGENPGVYGQAYILLKSLAPAAFFVSGFLAALLEGSNINTFWKFYWIPYLLTAPWLIPTPATLQPLVIWFFIIVYINLKKLFFVRQSKKFNSNFKPLDSRME